MCLEMKLSFQISDLFNFFSFPPGFEPCLPGCRDPRSPIPSRSADRCPPPVSWAGQLLRRGLWGRPAGSQDQQGYRDHATTRGQSKEDLRARAHRVGRSEKVRLRESCSSNCVIIFFSLKGPLEPQPVGGRHRGLFVLCRRWLLLLFFASQTLPGNP